MSKEVLGNLLMDNKHGARKDPGSCFVLDRSERLFIRVEEHCEFITLITGFFKSVI